MSAEEYLYLYLYQLTDDNVTGKEVVMEKFSGTPETENRGF